MAGWQGRHPIPAGWMGTCFGHSFSFDEMVKNSVMHFFLTIFSCLGNVFSCVCGFFCYCCCCQPFTIMYFSGCVYMKTFQMYYFVVCFEVVFFFFEIELYYHLCCGCASTEISSNLLYLDACFILIFYYHSYSMQEFFECILYALFINLFIFIFLVTRI